MSLVHSLVNAVQTKIQKMIGVSQQMEYLENRIDDVELDMYSVKFRNARIERVLNETSCDAWYTLAFEEIDKYERDIERLESIFTSPLDNLSPLLTSTRNGFYSNLTLGPFE
jgi:hypothetical protein